ncbi:hypothetical protein NBRC116594_24220 [Shimia sp. NS0008-38b]|uniref:hypothetical protein n=1 Tax=Shimia sp. NS0008-38b TaxID=3127653 RepID=UPI003107792F
MRQSKLGRCDTVGGEGARRHKAEKGKKTTQRRLRIANFTLSQVWRIQPLVPNHVRQVRISADV